MKGLAWWMRIVGVFYVLLGVQNLPFIVRGRLATQFPGFEAPLDGGAGHVGGRNGGCRELEPSDREPPRRRMEDSPPPGG